MNAGHALAYVEVFDVLTTEQCERLIVAHQGQLERSTVRGAGGARYTHPARTSSSAKIDRLPEPIGEALALPLWRFTGLPTSHHERWEILRYNEGERFGPHFDLLPTCDGSGQRLYSAAITLRAPERGGELEFPSAGLCFAPERGKLLCWANTTRTGAQEPAALHASRPVLAGTKWALVTWIRANAIEGQT